MLPFAPSSAGAQPRVQSVAIVGAERTSQAVILDLLRLKVDEILTPEALALATRRLDELPAASRTQVSFAPVNDGRVEVRAMVDERSVFGTGLKSWGTRGARALLKDELRLDLSGPLGRGEVWSAAWRWSKGRPRVALELAVPAPGRLPGIAHVEAMWEEQSYRVGVAPDGAATIVREERYRGGAGLGDWLTSRLHWQGAGAFDHLAGRNYLGLDGAIDARLLDDFVSIGLGAGSWAPLGEGRRFGVADLSASWRLKREDIPPWSGVIGMSLASHAAPLALWPGASAGGSGRGMALRAHPLHEDGVVTSEVFGRRMVYLTVENQRQIYSGQFGRVALVGFLDAAKAWQRLTDPGATPLHVDIGAGVRLLAADGGGNIRLDFGYGLRDSEWAISAGWIGRWPKR